MMTMSDKDGAKDTKSTDLTNFGLRSDMYATKKPQSAKVNPAFKCFENILQECDIVVLWERL